MTDTPDDYWCKVPDLKNANLTLEEIRNISIPFTVVSVYSQTIFLYVFVLYFQELL